MVSLEELQGRAQAQAVSIHLILKEQIHSFILDYLFRKEVFASLVFQGGTALRIAYQGVRYSEDLDFVLKRRNDPILKHLPEVLEGLPSAFSQFPLFGQGTTLKVQKRTSVFQRFILAVPIEPLRVTDRTNIEIANVPSYENETVLIRNLEIPLTSAIRVETAREILSDKLIAFGAGEYIKGRDIWDLHFLLTSGKLSVDERVQEWVSKKISDYRLGKRSCLTAFRKHLSILEKNGAAILRAEMDRFLPESYRVLFKKQYQQVSEVVLKALRDFAVNRTGPPR